MVRADVAGQKVARAEARLRQVEELLSCGAVAFQADVKQADLASFYLLLATQECVDLAAHWLADAGWPPADDVDRTFAALAAHGAIPLELATEMRAVVRLRNRIAHGYATVDHARFHAEAPAGIAALHRFLGAVLAAANT